MQRGSNHGRRSSNQSALGNQSAHSFHSTRSNGNNTPATTAYNNTTGINRRSSNVSNVSNVSNHSAYSTQSRPSYSNGGTGTPSLYSGYHTAASQASQNYVSDNDDSERPLDDSERPWDDPPLNTVTARSSSFSSTVSAIPVYVPAAPTPTPTTSATTTSRTRAHRNSVNIPRPPPPPPPPAFAQRHRSANDIDTGRASLYDPNRAIQNNPMNKRSSAPSFGAAQAAAAAAAATSAPVPPVPKPFGRTTSNASTSSAGSWTFSPTSSLNRKKQLRASLPKEDIPVLMASIDAGTRRRKPTSKDVSDLPSKAPPPQSWPQAKGASPRHAKATVSSSSIHRNRPGSFRTTGSASQKNVRLLQIVFAGCTVFSILITIIYWRLSTKTRPYIDLINREITNDRDDMHPISTMSHVTETLSNYEKESRALTRKSEGSSIDRITLSKLAPQISEMRQQHHDLQKERDALIAKYRSPEQRAKEERFIDREGAFLDLIDKLQEATRKESKRTVLERFGPGPHQVIMTYAIPKSRLPSGRVDPETGKEIPFESTSKIHKPHPINTFQHKKASGGGSGGGGFTDDEMYYFDFVIQTAPLHLVPHAVHVFLEQVEHGLWNNTSHIYVQSGHVLQMGPRTNRPDKETLRRYVTNNDNFFNDMYYTPKEDARIKHLLRQLEDEQLDALAFPDYHEEFPHTPWTVGFAGRPGGPDFYINMDDNREAHSPGGQHQHALGDEQGDACFGRIVFGKSEIFQILMSLPTHGSSSSSGSKEENGKIIGNPDWLGFLIEPVPIISASILNKGGIEREHIQHHGPYKISTLENTDNILIQKSSSSIILEQQHRHEQILVDSNNNNNNQKEMMTMLKQMKTDEEAFGELLQTVLDTGIAETTSSSTSTTWKEGVNNDNDDINLTEEDREERERWEYQQKLHQEEIERQLAEDEEERRQEELWQEQQRQHEEQVRMRRQYEEEKQRSEEEWMEQRRQHEEYVKQYQQAHMEQQQKAAAEAAAAAWQEQQRVHEEYMKQHQQHYEERQREEERWREELRKHEEQVRAFKEQQEHGNDDIDQQRLDELERWKEQQRVHEEHIQQLQKKQEESAQHDEAWIEKQRLHEMYIQEQLRQQQYHEEERKRHEEIWRQQQHQHEEYIKQHHPEHYQQQLQQKQLQEEAWKAHILQQQQQQQQQEAAANMHQQAQQSQQHQQQ